MFQLRHESLCAARSFSTPQQTSADAAETVNFVPEPDTRDELTPPSRVNFVNFATLLLKVGRPSDLSRG